MVGEWSAMAPRSAPAAAGLNHAPTSIGRRLPPQLAGALVLGAIGGRVRPDVSCGGVGGGCDQLAEASGRLAVHQPAEMGQRAGNGLPHREVALCGEAPDHQVDEGRRVQATGQGGGPSIVDEAVALVGGAVARPRLRYRRQARRIGIVTVEAGGAGVECHRLSRRHGEDPAGLIEQQPQLVPVAPALLYPQPQRNRPVPRLSHRSPVTVLA